MATVTEDQVIEALKDVFDPEIPVDVYNFGLIYGIEVSDEDAIKITMTLTSESCPSALQIPEDIKKRVLQIAGAKDCAVDVVWDPKWGPEKISEEGRKILGLDEDDQ